MPGKYEETQAMVDLVKAGARTVASEDFKEKRKAFMPSLQTLEDKFREELRAVEAAEAYEDGVEIQHRWERIRGKYQVGIKCIDEIQAQVRRLHKVIDEMGPLVDEQVQRAIEYGGYDDPTA